MELFAGFYKIKNIEVNKDFHMKKIKVKMSYRCGFFCGFYIKKDLLNL